MKRTLTAATALALIATGAQASDFDTTRTAALNLTSARAVMPMPRFRPGVPASPKMVVVATSLGAVATRAIPPATRDTVDVLGDPAQVASATTEYVRPVQGRAVAAPATYVAPAVDVIQPTYPVPVQPYQAVTEPYVVTPYVEPLEVTPIKSTYFAPTFPNQTIYSEPDALEDRRILDLDYDPSRVYEIDGYMGYVTTLSFGERITAITIGDPSAWDVKPLGDKKIVSIKPINASSRTNMIVTGKSGRIFTFRLIGRENSVGVADTQITYRASFNPPPKKNTLASSLGGGVPVAASARGVKATDLNFDYTARGDELLTPIRAFDDGVKTYFQFPENTRAPAMFTVDSTGSESLVNYTVNGQYFVVQGVAQQFTLRDGSTATCIYNKSFPGPKGRDNGSPLIEGATRDLAV